jgi:hypothetical protein
MSKKGHAIFSHHSEVKFIAEIHGLEKSTEGRRIIVARFWRPTSRRLVSGSARGARRWQSQPVKAAATGTGRATHRAASGTPRSSTAVASM